MRIAVVVVRTNENKRTEADSLFFRFFVHLDMGTLTEEMQHLETSDYMGAKCESRLSFLLSPLNSPSPVDASC